MSDTYTSRVDESILRGLRALTDQTIAEQTADALDYSPAELDDLVGRKVEEAPFSGDALARIIRARRGTARATGQPDPYGARHTVDTVRRVWGSYRGIWIGENTNRRMVAGGKIDPAWGMLGWGESYVNEDGDVFRWYPLVSDAGPTIVRGPNY